MAKISAYSEQTDPDDNDLHIIVRGGVNYKIKLSTMLEYTPTTPGDWGSPEPTTIKEALDALAASSGTAVVADADYGDIVVSSSGTVWSLDSSINFVGKQLNNGTWDNPLIQNGVINDCAIDTVNTVDVNALVFSINDNADPTKQARFVSSGIAAGTVRSFTFPNASGTLALTSDIIGQGTGLDVDAYGFRGIPQNSQSGNYTTVAADAGKHIIHASGAGAGDTFTIDSNANVAYELGTAITFVNMDSNNLSIAITSDTMNLAGAGTTGTRTLAQYGIATAIKVASTTWLISGTNLT